ncbi:MAG: methyl-accepting chemotaxis protein, partial [Alphaproteobacteria bacterium]|nr:methyl-accepting chemotaxis protein [Alphaproteobacteria bacterium]
MNLGKYAIGTKISAIIVLLGIIIVAVAGTGIYAMREMNRLNMLTEEAAAGATEGNNMARLVTSLNRAEFRIAADPSPENLQELRTTINRERTNLDTQLRQATETAPPRRRAQLDRVAAAYATYLKGVDATLDIAGRNGASVTIGMLQQGILDKVRENRETARNLNESIETYVEMAEEIAQQNVQQSQDTFTRITTLLIAVSVIGLIVGALMGFFIARYGIITPIQRIVAGLRELANGNLSVAIFGTERKDEIGTIAETMQVFKDNMVRTREMEQEAEEAEKRAEIEKRQAMNNLADQFEENVGTIVGLVSAAATELEAAAQTLNTTLEETNAQASTVAAAANEATTNVETVATACEELAASVREIGQQVNQSSQISGRAVTNAESTKATVEGLVISTQKIGEVVKLINDIAEQTNLLA